MCFWFLFKTGGTALRQSIDLHSTSACGLSGVASCPRGSLTSVPAPAPACADLCGPLRTLRTPRMGGSSFLLPTLASPPRCPTPAIFMSTSFLPPAAPPEMPSCEACGIAGGPRVLAPLSIPASPVSAWPCCLKCTLALRLHKGHESSEVSHPSIETDCFCKPQSETVFRNAEYEHKGLSLLLPVPAAFTRESLPCFDRLIKCLHKKYRSCQVKYLYGRK